MEGAGRLPLGAHRVPVPGARPAQACWLHPEPAPRDAGGGSQDQSRRLHAPLPQQQGTKVGQGGRRGPRRDGGGAEELEEGTRGRGSGEGAWKSKTMCAVGHGGQGTAAEGLLKITSELTGRVRGVVLALPRRSFLSFISSLSLRGLPLLIPSASSGAPIPHWPSAKGL